MAAPAPGRARPKIGPPQNIADYVDTTGMDADEKQMFVDEHNRRASYATLTNAHAGENFTKRAVSGFQIGDKSYAPIGTPLQRFGKAVKTDLDFIVSKAHGFFTKGK